MRYITPATIDHALLIRKLALRIWPVCYRDILTHEQIQSMLTHIYAEANLIQEMQNGHRFWIIYEENVPSGFVSAYKENDIIWIKKLYIDTAQQRNGLGTALMNEAINALLPATQTNLLVNPNNTPAHSYYQHVGFIKSGEKPVKMGDFEFTDTVYSRPITVK